MGIRGYRKNWKGALGKPDLAWPKLKLAVFVDSCFWHFCPIHCKMPRTNKRFWREKLMRNRKRDAEVTVKLAKEGWKVLRLWTHVPLREQVEAVLLALPVDSLKGWS